jgi:hypothetical protein
VALVVESGAATAAPVAGDAPLDLLDSDAPVIDADAVDIDDDPAADDTEPEEE